MKRVTSVFSKSAGMHGSITGVRSLQTHVDCLEKTERIAKNSVKIPYKTYLALYNSTPQRNNARKDCPSDPGTTTIQTVQNVPRTETPSPRSVRSRLVPLFLTHDHLDLRRRRPAVSVAVGPLPLPACSHSAPPPLPLVAAGGRSRARSCWRKTGYPTSTMVRSLPPFSTALSLTTAHP
jgi:hypothetical protein